jgi:phosphoribosylformylglycinamidine synthase I
MKTAVITFPASNCDRDMLTALEGITGKKPHQVWHQDNELPKVDLIAIPGGFSHGDYLRSGAIAARSNIMQEVINHAKRGGLVLGVCNGFQILTEAGLLSGVLLRNQKLKFICKKVRLRVENNQTAFSSHYANGDEIEIPIAHHDGNYFNSPDEIKRLEDENRIIFRYLWDNNDGNGSINDIAGICNEGGNVLGMMPHPERACDELTAGIDGKKLFQSIIESL